MKRCEHYELLASLLLDGEATEAEQAELTAHLETCPECRAYFEDIKRIHEVFVQESAEVPGGFSAQVMDRVRKTKQDGPEHKKTILFPHWRRWAALAACCAVVVLSVWAYRSAPGRTESVTANVAPYMAMDTGREAAGAAPAAQEPEAHLVEEDAAADGAALPEEEPGQAKSAVREEVPCQPQASSAQAPTQEPDTAAGPAINAASGGETDAPPVPGPAVGGRVEPKDDGEDSAEDNAEPEQQPEYGDSGAEPSPAAPVPEETEEAEEPAEPVEVIGVPEPGIVVAYGPAAQSWVEDALGLEWAIGGSYPLTAEQYSDLLRALDEAGEPYSIAEGEDYCLMTE